MLIIERLKDSFLTVLSWFKHPELIHPEPEEYIELPVADAATTTDQPAPEKKESFPKTLSALLDNIEATFDTYTLKFSPNSWLNKDDCIGLRKLGAHVPQDRLIPVDKLVSATKKPTMFLVSSGANHDEEGSMKYMFGIKHKKLPWYVKRVQGVPYMFGMAHKFEKELFWIHGWIVITPDNKVVLCEELRYHPVRLPNGSGYMRRKMDIPEVAASLTEGDIPKDEVVRMSFIAAFNWWVGRSERWSVAVLSKGERLTFSVPKEDTKRYFANRDKSVKTATGRAKKIVHYVHEHDRVINGKTVKVKEHIRGLSVFNWNGYKCIVTAPELQHAATIMFDVTPVEDNEVQANDFIHTSKVGHLLAQREDADSLRRHIG